MQAEPGECLITFEEVKLYCPRKLKIHLPTHFSSQRLICFEKKKETLCGNLRRLSQIIQIQHECSQLLSEESHTVYNPSKLRILLSIRFFFFFLP